MYLNSNKYLALYCCLEWHTDLVLTENWTFVRSTRGPFPWGMDGWVSTTKELQETVKQRCQEISQGNHKRARECNEVFPKRETFWVSFLEEYLLFSAIQVFGPSQGRCHRTLFLPAPPAYQETPAPGTDTLPHRWTYKTRRKEQKWWCSHQC